ncbi:MAG: sigma-70 family RNA polymerase sigma factor [Acidobacteriia bacterium]|nr:sigma-70 family RNA polymerase sigma factor [Terriglobia bacterium]
MAASPGEVTQLLHRLSAGDTGAREQLVALVYDELRRLAGSCMRRERLDHTLQPTALVHEAWLRLVEQREWNLENRAHFFGMAAQLMRRILVDHARAASAEKRGGDKVMVPLENAMAVALDHPAQLLDFHRALERLDQFDQRRARIAEMRFFGGFSIDEIADLNGVAPRTVDRQWRAARAWLSRELSSNLGAVI